MNKQDLIQKLKQLDGLTTDEKASLIDLVKTKKKYGLVWEDKPEAVEEQLRQFLPVLKEVKEKRILANDIEPTKNATNELFVEEKKTSKNSAPNHILIEGDNLHALTALTFTHEGKIDIIYIDPPYNTGNKDFKYNDVFVDKEDSYRHSKWLSFMEKRLKVAKSLLGENGVIFISIDDNEQAQLKLLCDEVFLEENIMTKFIWRTDGNFDNQAQIKNCHEYILAYSTVGDKFKVSATIDPNVSEDSKLFNDNIQNTIVKNGPKNPIGEVHIPIGFPCLFEQGTIKKREDKYPYYSENVEVNNYCTTNEVFVKSGWSSRALLELFIKNDFTPILDLKNQLTEFKISETGSIEAIKVRADQSHIISVLMNMGNTQSNSNKLLEMGIKFSYPKPISLLEYLMKIVPNKSAIILDFFAGSGTTLHAAIKLNAEDGGNRQCLIVTNNENNICEEVTYARNKKIIEGYTTTKGKYVQGLKNNNLRYFKSEFVSSTKNEINKRLLTQASTELLQIKENCYTDITEGNGFNPIQCGVFTNEIGKYMIVVYHSRNQNAVCQQLIEYIITLAVEQRLKLYAFSPEKETLAADFDEVADKIDALPLPDAIYNAYRAAFRTLRLDRKILTPAEAIDTDTTPELFDTPTEA
jgi:adenine-specific DNA-methyltransferase